MATNGISRSESVLNSKVSVFDQEKHVLVATKTP